MDDDPVLTGSAHRGAAVIAPVWQPLAEFLMSTDLLPAPSEWEGDRQALRDIGRAGFVEVWSRLGLHPRPDDSAPFYLSVTDPDS